MAEPPSKEGPEVTGKGWRIALGLVTAFMVVAVAIALTQSPQVTIGASEATLREEIRLTNVMDQFWLVFPLTLLLFLMGWTQDALKESAYAKALLNWSLAMATTALVLWQGRNTLTVSELRVNVPAQSMTCSGYLLGRKSWSESMLFSQVQQVTFPPLSGRYGVLVKGPAGAEFCSLDWKLLERAQAERVWTLLAPLGSRATKP